MKYKIILSIFLTMIMLSNISCNASYITIGKIGKETVQKDDNEIISSSDGWIKTFGGPMNDEGRSVQQTSDGGYIIVGHTRSISDYYDVWLIKTNSEGVEEWNRIYGDGGIYGDYGFSVQQTNDGGYIFAGFTVEFLGDPHFNAWLVKTDSTRIEEWNRNYGGNDDDGAYSVQQTNDGGYILAGRTKSYGAGNFDFWLIIRDADGNMEWSQTFGGSDADAAEGVRQTSDGGYILVGSTYSFSNGDESDIWLIKTDKNGNKEWDKNFGGNVDDYGQDVKQTNDGGYIIAGWCDTDYINNLGGCRFNKN